MSIELSLEQVMPDHISMSSNPPPVAEGFIDYESYPSIVKRRVRALKKLQFEKFKVDGDFNREVFNLQIKYAQKYDKIVEKRRDIVSGKHEPNNDECDFNLDEDDLSNDVQQKISLSDENGDQIYKGIPGFWLLAMKNDEEISERIEPHDEPVLMHLMDIRVVKSNNPFKIVLEFVFDPNDYFTNSVLTKEYYLRFGPDPKFPWDLKDYLVVNCKGCQINWKEGKNLRKKAEKKSKKLSDSPLVVTLGSFFEFFDPPVIPEKFEDIEEKTHDLLADDWRLGKAFIEDIVPNAVLHMTGDIYDDDYSTESESSSSGSSFSHASTDSLSPMSSSEGDRSPAKRRNKNK